MNVLHFLATGGTGGIESLIREYADKSELNNYYIVFWGGGANSNIMKERGCNVIELSYGKKQVIETYKALVKYVEKYKIDAIVTHHAAPAMWFYMSLLKNRFPNLKTYIYAHANLKDILREEHIQSIIGKRIFRTAFNKCDNVIAISNSVKQSFASYGYSLDKIKVIYNGVDCDRFKPTDKETVETVRLAYVGRLIKQKGVDRLVRAIGLLDDNLNFTCDIVGDGVEKENLEHLARELKVDNKITFHGIRSDVDKFLSNEMVFVHPASWEEGFGIAVVEAMAAGLVPIAFKKGALPEIIDNGVNGFVVDEETPESLAKTLTYVINNYNSNEMDEIRQAAIKKSKKFDLKIFVSELDSLIQSGER
ncbi:Glycosyltransferase involved in cell wall bisynthesis [Pseudobutyrivibrio sp. 49]|uniref:glycosyltransferase family 4 protein n=1 Tax=Pseudobutyrivibrio sp. 49 TaxID=1855344 RepID=UPI000882C96D|nr:glycosyltransferase family 4 protein [Pseudobutyrivibrio sp. 49]SDI72290.1 Glycosyltransferase involved in cell wall bisynthesis [Pseudobutyrivibrio sp. 49]